MLSQRSTSTSLTRVVATDLSAPNGLVVDRAIIPGLNGTATGVPAAGNVTFAVAWRTGRGGRSYRGRTYHIGMTEGMRTGNSINGTLVNDILAAYTSLITLGVTPIFHLQVVSRQQGNLWINPAIATEVTAATLDIFLDSQRRRLHGK